MTAQTETITLQNVRADERVLRLSAWQVSMVREALARHDHPDADWLRRFLDSEADDAAWRERQDLVRRTNFFTIPDTGAAQ